MAGVESDFDGETLQVECSYDKFLISWRVRWIPVGPVLVFSKSS